LKADHKQALRQLFFDWSGQEVNGLQPFPRSGSNRIYYRLIGDTRSAIGAYNPDDKENQTFIYMSRFFKNERIQVPGILAEDLTDNIYLLEDLGDQTLFDLIRQHQPHPERDPVVREKVREVMRELARIQVMAGRKMDFSRCYPYQQFDEKAILYDLNYFREQFADQMGAVYRKHLLERDFRKLAGMILGAGHPYFMYRDFQSRNIMVHQDNLYFIDYQGGRKGPLQYDLAAFLYQARARWPDSFRQEMIGQYLKTLRILTPVDEQVFRAFFYPVALLRVLQTLGAYGLRGLKEGKQHFIQSIPPALENLRGLYSKNPILQKCPELQKTLDQLMHSKISDHGFQY